MLKVQFFFWERLWTKGENFDNSKSNGDCTNSVAEYKALDLLATRLDELDESKDLDRSLVSMLKGMGVMTIVGDSEVIINQMNGTYAVCKPHLQTLNEAINGKIARAIARFGMEVRYRWTCRTNNTEADAIANRQLAMIKNTTASETDQVHDDSSDDDNGRIANARTLCQYPVTNPLICSQPTVFSDDTAKDEWNKGVSLVGKVYSKRLTGANRANQVTLRARVISVRIVDIDERPWVKVQWEDDQLEEFYVTDIPGPLKDQNTAVRQFILGLQNHIRGIAQVYLKSRKPVKMGLV